MRIRHWILCLRYNLQCSGMGRRDFYCANSMGDGLLDVRMNIGNPDCSCRTEGFVPGFFYLMMGGFWPLLLCLYVCFIHDELL